MYLNLPARAWVNPIDGSRHPLGVCLGWTYRTRREGKGPMAETSFAESVGRRREIEITTIGRRSGREISLPVWFVRRNETVLLLPVYGSDTNWYKNVLKDPTIKIVAGRAERSSTAVPITDPPAVRAVVDAFRDKYGPLESYFPKTDVAVEVPATGRPDGESGRRAGCSCKAWMSPRT